LAAKLTGWKIDVKSEEQAREIFKEKKKELKTQASKKRSLKKKS
jgi:transcription antitermination factor NusA-like protein